MKEKKKRFKYATLEIGEKVYVKKALKEVVGLQDAVGEITQIGTRKSGITVKFPHPIDIKYRGWPTSQKTSSFTFRVSYLNYLP